MGELDGKVAVITGAGSGMARATAEVFVREGARVLAADISGRQQETADALGDACVPFTVDVTNEADVEAMFAAAVDAFGKVDAVLNVAGIAAGGALAEIALDEYDRILGVDLKGVMLGTKHGIRTMVPTGGGVILNWSSIGGMNGSRMPTSVYSAAKAGVISVTRTAAVEYADKGIRVNCVCPGYIKTEGMGATLDHYPGAAELTPMKRLGQAHEIAEVAAFLCSDRASFVTGAVVPIDGGRSILIP